jgi:D-alanyl-D-alanine carboxypeptidase/D-alanyl-D-alanine-endopeptidase (penicillin-binding protein 4)
MIKWKKTALIFLSLILAHCAMIRKTAPVRPDAESSLKAEILSHVAAPETQNAFWGMEIRRLGATEPFLALNEGRNFMPASNMKLYTTSAAFCLLGKDFRFETPISYTGEIGKDGVLRGDVIIYGKGDPAISGRYRKGIITTDSIMKDWVAALRTKGIKSIEGNILGDDDYFVDFDIEGSWEYDELPYWYSAPSSALSINDNLYDMTISPGAAVGTTARLVTAPPIDYVTFQNDVITTVAGAHRHIDFRRGMDNNNVRIFGHIPIGGRRWRDRGCVFNPTLYTATLFQESLTSEGISVSGRAFDLDTFSDAEKEILRRDDRVLYVHISPPLSEIIKIVNKPSQNFYADMFLKTLGRRFRGEGSFESGALVVKDFLKNIGAPDVESIRMNDGSGLSRRDLVQPRQTLHLLQYMATRPDFEAFYDSLAIAGVDGTIGGRMNEPPAKNNVHAKTGFIGNVRSLSGYLDDQNGDRWVFSIMCNQYTISVSVVDHIIDNICQALVKFKTPDK